MHFGGHQSLCLLNCLRAKNTLKQGKFLTFLKLTAKPKVIEKVMKFEEPKRVQTLIAIPGNLKILAIVLPAQCLVPVNYSPLGLFLMTGQN